MKGNWKLYLILIAVGLGGFFEAIKSFKVGQAPGFNAQLTPSELAQIKIAPYSVSDSDLVASRARSQVAKKRRVLLSNRRFVKSSDPKEVAAHSFTETLDENGKKKKVKGKDKKGKKDKKKSAKKDKDKKKKKAKVKETDPKLAELDQDADQEENDELENTNSQEQEIVSNGPAVITENKDDEKTEQQRLLEEEYEKWADLVLVNPHFGNTTEMISAFQSGGITPEIFHQIVTNMLSDNRYEMKKLGVLAAGSTPSQPSFMALIGVIEKEGAGSSLGASSYKNLKRYENVQSLGVIRSILSASNNKFAVVTATTILDTIVKTHRQPTDENSSQEVQERNLASQTQTFEPFLALLEEIVNQSNDPYVSNSAQQTLDSIHSLLGA